MSVGAIEESVSRRQRNRKSASVLRWVLLGIALIIVLVVSLYESASHGFGGPGEPVTFEVKAGQSVSTVISSLSSDGVISSGVGFKVFDLIHGNPSPRPGWYTIERNSTFQSVHDALGAGPNTPVLDVPPGFTLREVVARLDSLVGPAYGSHVNRVLKGQEGGVRSSYEPVGASDLEGLIGSGSYLIPPGFHNHPNAAMTSTKLVRTMVSRFEAMAARAGLHPQTSKSGLDSYGLITVASIVEKEGYFVRNMPKVPTVIFNRLAAGMPLQMDSTVLYALGQDGGRVSHATLQTQTPYNTYLNHGLPPTPICTVSPAALAATMNPVPGSWLFFTVVDRSGTEAFSSTFAEQLANEKLAAERGL